MSLHALEGLESVRDARVLPSSGVEVMITTIRYPSVVLRRSWRPRDYAPPRTTFACAKIATK